MIVRKIGILLPIIVKTNFIIEKLRKHFGSLSISDLITLLTYLKQPIINTTRTLEFHASK